MKKIISIFLILVLSFIFTGCEDDEPRSKKSKERIECSACGQKNDIDAAFCSDCGCGLVASTGTANPFDDEYTNQAYTILDYFKNTGDKPVIVYTAEIAKDEEIGSVYVIKNGQCRMYYTSATMGEVSKMTDEEILDILEQEYQDGLKEALDIWHEDNFTSNAINEGTAKLYQPRFYDINGCLFTDDSGNSVVGEMLFLPTAGIGGSPYILKYPQHTDEGENYFMNYFGTTKDSDSPWDIKFEVKHFNRGTGTKSDLNKINNLVYLTENSITYGAVYDSYYCGISETSNEWTEYETALCFRISNPNNFQLRLDQLSSKDITYIDPSENELLTLSRLYYNTYYSSFGEFPEEKTEHGEYETEYVGDAFFTEE